MRLPIGETLLVLWGLLRILNIFRSRHWLQANGQKYFNRLALATYESRKEANRAKTQLIQELGGDFLPFGIKGHRWKRWARGGSSTVGRVVRRAVGALYLPLWWYPGFALVSVLLLVALTSYPKALKAPAEAELIAYSFILLIVSLALAFEDRLMREYMSGRLYLYHGLWRWRSPSKSEGANLMFTVATVGGAWASLAGGVYFLGSRTSAFQTVDGPGLQALIDAAYVSLPPPFHSPAAPGTLLAGFFYFLGIGTIYLHTFPLIPRWNGSLRGK